VLDLTKERCRRRRGLFLFAQTSGAVRRDASDCAGSADRFVVVYRGWRSPALAGIIGACREWTVSMISALLMPCR
jgi:hypothetical protein